MRIGTFRVWERWFAWFPVRTQDGRVRWNLWLERRNEGDLQRDGHLHYSYREITDGPPHA